ncbi:MAG: nitrous oxide reductase accessory protein NosL [Paracoccus sp. (in: a-proteobacteria)]|uniref:nitrous oxide reductase accessory protein NosL n=1 Tax=Paracoccus sp. TaxID=267 RepID=UPI0026DFD529|nr:nitrous oxide reductase accessory protein NosL [Paracoccus sp. (in: a-proteobacteria)]MDO5622502.1 nitrous oxide reductase accessory protein NosL [Paracoccus sp. (in: a-proteobacteria)]
MKRFAIIALLALAACRQEAVEIPEPVALTETAIGHFCQMNLVEHPGPKGQVHLKDILAPLFFSQVRDAIAYLRMPEQDYEIVTTYVSDMGVAPSWDDPGATNWIPAADAFYVVGSSREGGMGAAETVPFGTEDAARAFAAQYGGEIMRLDDIPTELVLAPAASGPQDDTDVTEDVAGYADRLRNLTNQGDRP